MNNPMAVFRRRRFATVVIGEGVSMVGDAAFEIALAWTILSSTGSVAALAGVLLFQAVPRGVLLLLGGAVVDRYSPRAVMLVTHIARAVALALMAFIAAIGTLALWHLAALALVMGASAAFFSPASESIVPSLVEGDETTRTTLHRCPGNGPMWGRSVRVTSVVREDGATVGPIPTRNRGRHGLLRVGLFHICPGDVGQGCFWSIRTGSVSCWAF